MTANSDTARPLDRITRITMLLWLVKYFGREFFFRCLEW